MGETAWPHLSSMNSWMDDIWGHPSRTRTDSAFQHKNQKRLEL